AQQVFLTCIQKDNSTTTSTPTVIASLQIALTQPLLLDDYVCIDGQYGIVEEIQTQYLVLKTEKDSRIIIPLTRVIDQSFENYTRGGDTIGTTFQLF
ncbi:3603_t:CDS:2, partial [Paraglomus occultum]